MTQRFNALGFWPRLILLAMLILSMLSLYLSFRAAVADSISLQARWQTMQWQHGKAPQPDAVEWGLARNDIVAAINWTPQDPQLYEDLGYLYGVRAVSAKAVPEIAEPMLDDAIAYFRTATTLRPMSPYAWANLALALHLRHVSQEAMWQAFDHAHRYGNREAGVQVILAEIGLSHWKEAGQDRQALLLEMINGARAHAKGDLLVIAKKHNMLSALAQ